MRDAKMSDGDRKSPGAALVLSIAAAKLLFHLLIANRYGIFRDELYYLACSEHLDAGYVDQPPLIGFIAWIARRDRDSRVRIGMCRACLVNSLRRQ